jgi:peptidylprolyl isomerase
MSGPVDNKDIWRSGIRWGCGLALLAGLSTMPVACKRKPAAPPTINRPPRAVGPSSEELAKEARAKLMAELDAIPPLDFGKPFVASDGENWVLHDNGMMIHVLKPGDGGMKPRLGQTVSVAYFGYIPGTTQAFDRRIAEDPLVFKLGTRDLVKGFSIAVATMSRGEKTRFFVPGNLAYGKTGRLTAGIGADQALIFEVELLSISGEAVGYTLEDLPKIEQMGPPAPAVGGATKP